MRNLRNQTPENNPLYALSKKEKPNLILASLTHFITFGHVQPTYTVGWRDSYWEDLLSTVSVCVRVYMCVCLVHHPHEHTSTKASIFTLPVENAIAMCGGGHTKFKGRWPFTRTRKRRPALTRFIRKLARRLLLVGAKRVERVFYAQRI